MGDVGSADPFAGVVGQDAAVAFLRSAIERPVHAYLFVGRPGAGSRAAARAFGGELLGRSADDGSGAALDRARRLAATESHPAMFVHEREGASISVDQARSIVHRSGLAPPEGDLQVFVLTDFHLVAQAGPTLLKAIEEPPASTVFVILADEVTPDLVTISSRCTVVEFPPIASGVVRDHLVSEGVDASVADVAALAAGGDLDRARLLAGDPRVVARREAWFTAPDRLDGTGHTAMVVADHLVETLDEVAAPLQELHAAELLELDTAEQTLGERRPGERKRMQERHQREERRVRADELRAGLVAIMDRYRDAVGTGAPAEDFVRAASLVQELCDALVFNPRERLQIESLLLHLPPLGGER
jgi:DNA polymerase-3 subunit delta'